MRDARPFRFDRDTLAFANDLYWSYEFDAANGTTVAHRRDEEIAFGNRCVAMSLATRQFHDVARFDPSLPKLSEADYRERIRGVLRSNPRRRPSVEELVVIPGYDGLHDFSRDHEGLLKSELGGRSWSFTQRGNWRMIFPFLPGQSRDTAYELVDALSRGQLPLVRLVQFPRVTVNHTVMVLDAEADALEIRFFVYDANHPERPMHLTFRRGAASFALEPTNYFGGGSVYAYEIFDGLLF